MSDNTKVAPVSNNDLNVGDNADLQRLLKLANRIAVDNVQRKRQVPVSALVGNDMAGDIADINIRRPNKGTATEKSRQNIVEQLETLTKEINEKDAGENVQQAPSTDKGNEKNRVTDAGNNAEGKAEQKVSDDVVAEATGVGAVVAANGLKMSNIFGYTLPTSTLYLIIITIVIAVILFYMTSPPSVNQQKKNKKKKDNE
jgi:type II secretory pathway pseudopilin PulG